MAFDIEGARKAGYSAEEIADYLGQESGFDTASALKSGYTPDEVIGHLSATPAKSAETAQPEKSFFGSVVDNATTLAKGVAASNPILGRALTVAQGPQEKKIGSVLEGKQMPGVPFDPAEADRLSRRDYAEEQDQAQRIAKAPEMRAPRDPILSDRQQFAERNPITAGFAQSAASTVAGTLNAPSVVAGLAGETVNRVAQSMGVEQPAGRVPNMPLVNDIKSMGQDYASRLSMKSPGKAWDDGDFGRWMMTQLSGNSFSAAQSLGALFVPGAQATLLSSMGAVAGGNAYAEGDSASASTMKGLVEAGSEMLPLHAAEKIKDIVLAIPTGIRQKALAEAGKRLLASGTAVTTNSLVGAIEESVAEIGGNAIDKYVSGKTKDLFDGVDRAAIVGAAFGTAFSGPAIAETMANPASVRARELSGALQAGGFDPTQTQQSVMDALRTEQSGGAGITPAATTIAAADAQRQSLQQVQQQAIAEIGTAQTTDEAIAAAERAVSIPTPKIDTSESTESIAQRIRDLEGAAPIAEPAPIAEQVAEAPPAQEPQPPAVDATIAKDGTLRVIGDPAAIKAQLAEYGVANVIPTASGAIVGRSQAQQAQSILMQGVSDGNRNGSVASPALAENAGTGQQVGSTANARGVAQPAGSLDTRIPDATVREAVVPAATAVDAQPALTSPFAQQQRDDFRAAERARTAPGRRLRDNAAQANPFKAFIAKHGIAVDQRREFAPGVVEQRKAMVPGYGPIFRKTGKPLDMLANLAVEEGFLTTPDEAALYNMIGQSINGTRIIPQYTADAAESEMESRIARQQEYEEEAAAALSDLSDASIFDLEDSDVLMNAESNVSTEDFLRSLGASEQEIQDAIAEESQRAQANAEGRAGAEEAATSQAQGIDSSGKSQARSGVDLLGEAPRAAQQQAFAEQQRLANQERARRNAAPSSDDFTLGMEDARTGREVDPGQGDLKFSESTSTASPRFKPIPASTTAQRTVARLQESIRKTYPDATFQAVGIPSGAQGRKMTEAAETAKRLFGLDVNYVKFEGSPLFEGARSEEFPKAIFIRADTKKPHMAILGHELLHQMRSTKPELYKELNDSLASLLKNESRYSDLLTARYEAKGGTAPKDWMEELHGDIVGDNFADPQFWAGLARTKPGAFERIANAVRQFLNSILLKATPFGSEQYLKDVKAARDAVTESIRKFSEAKDVSYSIDAAKTLVQNLPNESSRSTPAAGERTAPNRSPGTSEQQAIADDIAKRVGARLGRPIVLDVVAPGRGESSARNKEESATVLTAKRLFNQNVIFVKQSERVFHGLMSAAYPNTVLIDIETDKPMMAILGHELLHQLRRNQPGIYRQLDERLTALLKNPGEFLDRIEAQYRNKGMQVPQNWDEELYADVVGDNFTDPEFWTAMAEGQPRLFQRVAQAIRQFLNNVLLKARPFGTDQFMADVKAARDAVTDAMRQFSGAEVGAMTDQMEGVALSVADTEAQKQTNTPAFKRWFSDSVVTKDGKAGGEPLVVYHGTNDNFNKISFKKGAQGLFWFASDKASIESGDAGAQGTKNIMELYAKIENPAGWEEYDKYGIDELESKGYDGVILPEEDGSFVGFVFKNAAQIKSATKNRGTFDPANPDIRFSLDGGDYGIDDATGLPLNADGTVTVYHHTSKANADRIRQTGMLKAAAEPDVYVTTRSQTDTGYGDTAVAINVAPDKLLIDDEFPDGRTDYRLEVGRPGGSMRVKFPGNATPDDIRYAIAGPSQDWAIPEVSRMDRLIYEVQDQKIDLRRVQESIKAAGKQIEEKFDARDAETNYIGRVSYRSKQFLLAEERPLLQAMALNKVSIDEISDYLHARGAVERNAQIAKINPDMPDGGAGTNSKGTLLTNDAARDYLASIPAARKKTLDMIAAKVDAITKGTRELLVNEGLEKPEVIAAWEAAYKNYVPMFRDEAESGNPHPSGGGFSVRGGNSQRATGSTKAVTNILAHVMMQRNSAIAKAEKNRVAMALYGLALTNPNPEFWTTIRPGMQAAQIAADLQSMGVDPVIAEAGMRGVPTVRTVDPILNKVVDRPNPMYKSLPGAVTLKIGGEDRVLMFNEKQPRALRMAEALKNLDGLTRFDLAGSIIGRTTRWLASVNTQYNIAFGIVNGIRDTFGGAVNLTSTPLRGKSSKVLFDAYTKAGPGIAKELANPGSQGEWSKLYRQFQEDGGQTGYREMFKDANERTKNIEKELTRAQKEGKLTPGKAAHFALDLLDGFNTTIENAVRLAAYKNALDIGMSRQKAAVLARELTVDFNRKGRAGRELGPLYAFFNASIQGGARTIEALQGPAGTRIITGGLALGALQAVVMAMAGFDDDEIPEFIKTRALIIPLFNKDKQFIAIPLPLGLHVLPNTGRVIAEMALNGGKNVGKRSFEAIGEVAGAFNPLGGGNIFTADGALRTVAPTIIDPIIELGFNKNFAGNTISRESRGETDVRPGFARAKESTQRALTGQAYLGISKTLNKAMGGTDYEAGLVSPTPEQLQYIAQVAGGGVLREMEKIINISDAMSKGDEVKKSRIPVIGRLFGEVDNDGVQKSRYFEESKKFDKAQAAFKAAQKAGDVDAIRKMMDEKPELILGQTQDRIAQQIAKLNQLAITTINDRETLLKIDEARLVYMRALNEAVKMQEEQSGKKTPGQKLREFTQSKTTGRTQDEPR